MLHVEIVEAACAAGKHVFCEKPVGGTPEQTVRGSGGRGCRRRDHRRRLQLPLRAARPLRGAARSATARLGEITNYRGRFFSMYGSDPLGLLSWRFEQDAGGLRRLLRPAQPRGRPGAHAARADRAASSARARRRSSPSGRCRSRGPPTTAVAQPDDPTGAGHQRGLRRRCSSCSRTGRAARSSPRARSSAPRARWRSTSTARRARSRGTSSG